jgi:hypothetical protein
LRTNFHSFVPASLCSPAARSLSTPRPLPISPIGHTTRQKFPIWPHFQCLPASWIAACSPFVFNHFHTALFHNPFLFTLIHHCPGVPPSRSYHPGPATHRRPSTPLDSAFRHSAKNVCPERVLALSGGEGSRMRILHPERLYGTRDLSALAAPPSDHPMRSGFWTPVESTGLPTPEMGVLPALLAPSFEGSVVEGSERLSRAQSRGSESKDLSCCPNPLSSAFAKNCRVYPHRGERSARCPSCVRASRRYKKRGTTCRAPTGRRKPQGAQHGFYC